MPDVIDFLILRQFYDEARQRNWQACKCLLSAELNSLEITNVSLANCCMCCL